MTLLQTWTMVSGVNVSGTVTDVTPGNSWRPFILSKLTNVILHQRHLDYKRALTGFPAAKQTLVPSCVTDDNYGEVGSSRL
ncbi:hypothetical protein J6590_082761 [Homalodisca vitripennis]|nr:hypothetical protein J6590_082761 [Homalodisca vitripennis]